MKVSGTVGGDAEFERVRSLLNLNRYDQVVTETSAILATDPTDWRVMVVLSIALREQDQAAAGLDVALQALAIAPDEPFAVHNHCRALVDVGRLYEAEPVARRLIELSPKWVTAWIDLAVVLYQQERMTEAFDAANRAVQLDPDDPDAHFLVGQAVKDRDEAMARQAFQNALAIDPQYTRAHFTLGLLDVKEDVAKGVQGLRSALASQESSERAVWVLDELMAVAISRMHRVLLIGSWLTTAFSSVPRMMGALTSGYLALALFLGVQRARPVVTAGAGGFSTWLQGFVRRDKLGMTRGVLVALMVMLCLITIFTGFVLNMEPWLSSIATFLVGLVSIIVTLVRNFVQRRKLDRMQ